MSRNPSHMNHTFSEVPGITIPRSSFNRSHSVKTTFDSGYLYPIFVDEALPGDTFKLDLTAFARMATPIYPVMDNLFMDVFFFSCPNRLLWDNWTKFMGEQDNPGDSIDYLVPTIASAAFTTSAVEGSIYDYMGIPTQVNNIFSNISSLPLRLYNRVYNEWFRDQNLQDSLTEITGDGPDLTGQPLTLYELKRRGKRHDYFTSALPWPQKGDSVDLPLGTTAPILGTADAPLFVDSAGLNPGVLTAAGSGAVTTPGPTGILYNSPTTTGLVADLSDATAATINQLRQAFQVQKLLERDARGGTRYVELVKSHFGVTTPSAGWRSEYLGGGTRMVNISPIAQTSETGTSPQGNLAAMGTVSMDGIGFTKSFTEHTTLIGPSLANIGEQAVLNQELVYTGTSVDTEAWAYQERYAEYRYKPSIITGKFRSNATGTLDAWHLAQDFVGLPPLNAAFIEDNPPVDRVIAVPSEPEFLFDGYFNMRCVRPMPLYGVPGMVDHF